MTAGEGLTSRFGTEFAPPFPGGRTFVTSRRVSLSDTTDTGRLRLDALARYLMDVATDDADDAGVSPGAWVLRRIELALHRLPVRGETVVSTTFCSGAGRSVAERRTSIADVDGEPVADSTAIWVYIDPATGRPGLLGSWFEEHYGVAAAGRRVASRLTHHAPSTAVVDDARAWSLRATDIDVLGHVNNAAYWEPVEDELARRAPGALPIAAQLEYRGEMVLLDEPRLASGVSDEGTQVETWLVCDGKVRSSAVVLLARA